MAAKKKAKRTKRPTVLHVKQGETLVVYRTKAKPCKARPAKKRAKKTAKKRAKKAAKKRAKKAPKATAGARHADGYAGWA